MTMRLNLDHILKHQTRTPVKNHAIGKNVPQQGAKPYLRLGAGSGYSNITEKPDVPSRVHSMVSNIHKYMKATIPPRKAVPTIPTAIAEMPTPVSVTRSSILRKNRRIRGGGVGTIATNKSSVMPISQIKARLNRQSQQIMRRGYSENGPKSFSNQRRIREVLMQKTVLENMLLQHKRLHRDRQTIALEIQRMRQDLDKIKTKLDTSQQALNSTRTLYAGFFKSKKGLMPMNLPLNVVNEASRSIKAKPADASMGHVTTRKQLLAPPKTRSRQVKTN